jgi:hypothetical protein
MSFMTRRLWQDLNYPTRYHPLFRVVSQGTKTPYAWTLKDFFTRMTIMLILVWAIFHSPYLMLTTIIGFAIVLPIASVVLNGTGFGVYWAIQTTHSVATLGKRMAWDLLQATPLSAYGSAWMVMSGRVHRGKMFQDAYRTVSWMAMLTEICLAAVIALIFITWHKPTQHSSLTIAFTVGETVRAMGLVAVLWLDHIQSVLMGCLVGMLTARLQGNTVSRFVTAGLGFISLKFVSFVAFLLIYALGEWVVRLWITDAWALVITGFMLPVIFLGVHEAVLRGVWRMVMRQYEG